MGAPGREETPGEPIDPAAAHRRAAGATEARTEFVHLPLLCKGRNWEEMQ